MREAKDHFGPVPGSDHQGSYLRVVDYSNSIGVAFGSWQ